MRYIEILYAILLGAARGAPAHCRTSPPCHVSATPGWFSFFFSSFPSRLPLFPPIYLSSFLSFFLSFPFFNWSQHVASLDGLFSEEAGGRNQFESYCGAEEAARTEARASLPGFEAQLWDEIQKISLYIADGAIRSMEIYKRRAVRYRQIAFGFCVDRRITWRCDSRTILLYDCCTLKRIMLTR